MAYFRMDASDVAPRWLVAGGGPNSDEPPYHLYAQTLWGLSRLSQPGFPTFDEAVEFLDQEIIGLTRLDNAS